MIDLLQNIETSPNGRARLSLTTEECQAFKSAMLQGRTYMDRVSMGFTMRLLQVQKVYGEYDCVLRELDHLEGQRTQSSTKKPTQFKNAPLHPLWHKHFATSQHMFSNIGIHWGIAFGGSGNKRFGGLINEVAQNDGDKIGVWPGKLAHRFMTDAWVFRAGRRHLTGDWIIYGKSEGKNYYLDIATHKEDDSVLFEKLRSSAESEFPFIFC